MRPLLTCLAIVLTLAADAGARAQDADDAPTNLPTVPFPPNPTPEADSDAPTDADAAYTLARAAYMARQYARAEADLNVAIKLRPDWFEAYMQRAVARERQNNLYGALKDYERAVALKPDSPQAHERRGRMYEISGDFAKAEADDTEALKLEPSCALLYFRRGVAEMILGQWEPALADFRDLETRAPNLGNTNYARIFTWYIQHQQGHGADADKALADYFLGSEGLQGTWVANVGAFLLGTMTQHQLLDAAVSPRKGTDRHQHCEAWFYVGLKALVAGDQKGAAADFQNCVALGEYHLAEHEMAAAKLKEWSGGP